MERLGRHLTSGQELGGDVDEVGLHSFSGRFGGAESIKDTNLIINNMHRLKLNGRRFEPILVWHSTEESFQKI